MNLKSLQIKIILIFSLPALTLIYFSYSLVDSSYIKYQESASWASNAKHAYNLSKLVHHIQLERGLSAGYIVSKDETIKHNLEKQYKMTDKAYKDLINFSNEHRKFTEKFHKLNTIRNEVLNAKLTFFDEMKYYNELNKELLHTISILRAPLKTLTFSELNKGVRLCVTFFES